ncbi:VWA domain-containing protein [Hydrogenimonas sp.]
MPRLAYVPRARFNLSKTPLFHALLFTLFVTALAGPATYKPLAAFDKKGRDLVLALDASGSMAESGFDAAHPNRRKYDVVSRIVSAFLKQRHDDNVGLVVFGSFAYAASPVTYDLRALEEILRLTDVGVAGQSTALGEALDQALRILRYGHAKRKVVVLLTDGFANAGSVSIAQAVERAKKAGVVVYTVGIGKPGMYDDKLLSRIAAETGGRAFDAADADDLAEVFAALDSLEPSPIRSEAKAQMRPLFYYPLLLAMVLLIAHLSLSFEGLRLSWPKMGRWGRAS